MSVLAASICEKDGELLLSRQFSHNGLAHLRQIEAAYTSIFNQKAHLSSTVEKDGLRYIFEPLDDLFVTLVCDADTSNIIEDLQTLRLLAQLVKNVVKPGVMAVTRTDIAKNYPLITDAFDEVVMDGFAEDLTAAQVDTFLQMESHEEKIQQIIERNKQLEAAEERKKRARDLEAQRQEEKRQRGAASRHANGFTPVPSTPPPMTQASSGSFGGGSFGGGSLGGNSFGSNTVGEPAFSSSSASYADSSLGSGANAAAHKGKSLKLGKKPTLGEKTFDGLQSQFPAPAKPAVPAAAPAAAPSSASSSKATTPAPSTTIDVTIAEQLTVDLTRDGQVKSSRVSGTLNLFAGDREHTKLHIKTTTGGGASDYKPHPKMDRALFANSRTLGLKGKWEQLPAAQVLLAKWTVDPVVVPISVSCWVSTASDAGFMNVTLEYEVSPDYEGTLENIAVNVPLPTSNAHAADPSSSYEQFDDHMSWLIPAASLDGEASGSFEFTAEADTENDFYPLDIQFTATGPTFGKITVDEVTDAETQEQMEFNTTVTAQTASFIIH